MKPSFPAPGTLPGLHTVLCLCNRLRATQPDGGNFKVEARRLRQIKVSRDYSSDEVASGALLKMSDRALDTTDAREQRLLWGYVSGEMGVRVNKKK